MDTRVIDVLRVVERVVVRRDPQGCGRVEVLSRAKILEQRKGYDWVPVCEVDLPAASFEIVEAA